ncbi:hypothetical protein WME94_06950 [Sorangium sp. So ce429]
MEVVFLLPQGDRVLHGEIHPVPRDDPHIGAERAGPRGRVKISWVGAISTNSPSSAKPVS